LRRRLAGRVDSLDVPAVDRDGDLVDLYGYTSLLLATIQASSSSVAARRVFRRALR
jgi:hypothetical protein